MTLKVQHEEYGVGSILPSTEQFDEEGQILTVDVMFEHGIEREVAADELSPLTEKGLFGKQEKLDKNDNGKLDSDDFKKLRKKGKKDKDKDDDNDDDDDDDGDDEMCEETETLGEEEVEKKRKRGRPPRVGNEAITADEAAVHPIAQVRRIANLTKGDNFIKKNGTTVHLSKDVAKHLAHKHDTLLDAKEREGFASHIHRDPHSAVYAQGPFAKSTKKAPVKVSLAHGRTWTKDPETKERTVTDPKHNWSISTKESVETAPLVEQRVSTFTADSRSLALENTIRGVLSQGRNLRKEAEEAKFKN